MLVYLALVHPVRRAHEIEIHQFAIICHNYLQIHCADCFQICVVAYPGPYIWTFFFEFLEKTCFSSFHTLLSFSLLNIGPYGSKNFKCICFFISILNYSKLFLFFSQWFSQRYWFVFLKVANLNFN